MDQSLEVDQCDNGAFCCQLRRVEERLDELVDEFVVGSVVSIVGGDFFALEEIIKL